MKFLVLAAGLSLCATGGARADDLSQLHEQTEALKRQNQKLAKRLEKLAHRHKVEPVARSSSPQPASAQEFIVSTSAAPLDVLTGDGPVTWHGVTLFGVIDAGVAWQSAGAPFNGAYPQGLEYAISKNSSRSIWSIAPGGMGYSGVGLKSEEEILPGVAGVLAVDTNFSSASGQLANGPASLVQNNGVAPASQSANGNSARAGQAFNDFAYVGVSSPTYGLLTFGRQRTLTTDDRVVYDPIGGSLAFSLLGYSGALSSGDTENSRFDHSIKYLVHIGPTRFGAIYKLGQSDSGSSPTNGSAYQLSAGFDYQDLSFDAVYSHVSGAVALSSLSAAQVLVEPVGSLAGAVSDNRAVLLSAKYTVNQLKFFGGYEHIDYADPKAPIAAPTVDSNGYLVSVVNNTAYEYHDKILQLLWTGFKYAYNSQFDVSIGYYHEWQNSYGKLACATAYNSTLIANASTCSGTEDAIGFVGEYHFNRRFEAYAGVMYSGVTGGMANGFLHASSFDPMVGLRYAF